MAGKGNTAELMSEIMADENIVKTKQDLKNPKRFPNKKHAIKKRLPVRPIEGDNVIYVTKKTNFKVTNLFNCNCEKNTELD